MNVFALTNPCWTDAISQDPIVNNWANRVVVNGGTVPTGLQQVAVNNFVRGMRQDFVWSKMKAMVIFVNNGLTCAFTPLIVGPGGADPWNANTFIAGDLTANGVIGDGASKRILTGLLPSTLFSSDGNAGVSIYVHTTTSANNQWDFGITNPADSTNMFQGTTNFNAPPNINLTNVWDNDGAAGQVTGVINSAGFFSINRVSTSDMRAYFAKTSTAWAQIAAAAAGTITKTRSFANNQGNTGIVIWATCATNGVPFNYSARRYSYISFHDGLTSAEGQLEFNRVQTFRLLLGGGTA
jgi:hypothetical protein